MVNPYLIRPTSVADLSRLVTLETSSFSDPWSEAQLAAVIDLPGGFGLIAEQDEEIVGHLLGRVVVDQGEILSVAVAPRWRRQGIAGTLLDQAMGDLARRQVTSVWLEVRVGNSGARALYASRGFTPRGHRLRYYSDPTEDALIMAWDAPPPRWIEPVHS